MSRKEQSKPRTVYSYFQQESRRKNKAVNLTNPDPDRSKSGRTSLYGTLEVFSVPITKEGTDERRREAIVTSLINKDTGDIVQETAIIDEVVFMVNHQGK